MSGPGALLHTALAAHKAGRLDEAGALYERIIALDPRNADALNLSGMLRLQRGDAAAAAMRIGRAADLQPRMALYRVNLAKAQAALGQETEAVASLRRAAQLAPDDGAVWQQLGLALRRQADLAGATAAFRRAAQAAPGDIGGHNNLAAVLLEQGRIDEARPAIARALALEADNPLALGNEGQALLLEGRAADAIAPLRRAAAQQPGNAMLLNNLGIALQDAWRIAEAMDILRQALDLAPDNGTIQVSYGNALKKAGHYEEALVQFDRALAARPGTAEIYTHIGTCQEALLRYDAALEAYDEALRLKSDERRARQNRGLTLLALGRFKNGWRDYVARDLRADLAAGLREPHSMADIDGQHVLLLGEQGLGDEIFFLRFAEEVRRRGARRIDAVVNPKIAPMMRRVTGFDEIFASLSEAPAANTTIAVGDLPLVLRMTTVEQIPPSLRLAPLAARTEEIGTRLAAFGPPPYLGVTWRAGTADRLGALFKLAPLADIGAALTGLPGTVVALQRLPQEGELAALAAAMGQPVHDMTALNDDLESMLALLAQLDDYVCVSNTNVHLRALVGRSCRVLVPAPPEFRWMAPREGFSGDESPWFPGSRVYRQTATRSWAAALADLRRDLEAAFG